MFLSDLLHPKAPPSPPWARAGRAPGFGVAKTKPSLKASILAGAAGAIVAVLNATLRFRIEDRAGVLGTSEPRLIWLFWHNRMFVIPHLLNRYLSERRGCALTSASRDGELLAALLKRSWITPVRGSSSRRGVPALRELIRFIRSGYDAAITPDGPRGPRYSLHAGALTLAQATGAKIMPIQVIYSRYWQLGSWDGFQIPKPFSTVTITLLPLEAVRPTRDETEFEQERARLEDVLRAEQVSA